MRLSCRKCGKEYELPADLRARGIYQITCKACGQLAVPAAAGESLGQAAGMGASRAPAPRRAAAVGAPAPGREAEPEPSPGGQVDEFENLFADIMTDSTHRAPTPPQGRSSASPLAETPASATAPGAPRITAPPSRPAPGAPAAAPTPEVEGAATPTWRGLRMRLIAGGAAALLGLLAGGLLLLRGSPPAARAEATARAARLHVISDAAPPLAAPDPEVAAAEAREEAERYSRLQENLRREGPSVAAERRSSPGPRRQAAPVLVGSVRPAPPVAQARVVPVPAARENLGPRPPLAEEVRQASATASPAAPQASAVEKAPALPAARFRNPAQEVGGGDIAGVPGDVIGGVVDAADAPVAFNESMTAPVVLSGPDPQYTDKALEHGVQGVMVVKCVVSLKGVVRNCRVLKSLPFMDRAVIDALEHRRYRPAVFQGKPIEVDYTFKIKLTLPQ